MITSSKPLQAKIIEEIGILNTLNSVTPLWELNSYVAVNPFLSVQNKSFAEGISILQKRWGLSLLPNAKTLRAEAQLVDSHQPAQGEFSAIGILGKFLGAYLDRGASVISAPFKGKTLWEAWLMWVESEASTALKAVGKFDLGAKYESPWDDTLGCTPELAEELLSLIPGYASYLRRQEWPGSASVNGDLSTLAYILLILDQELPGGLERPKPYVDGEAERKLLHMGREEAKAYEPIENHLKKSQSEDEWTGEVSAVFCIDVRSEPLRRHLESDPRIKTEGFAGFFGQFVTANESDTNYSEDHCPIFVKPGTQLDFETTDEEVTQSWLLNHKRGAPHGFGFVEVAGWKNFGALWGAFVNKVQKKASEAVITLASKDQQLYSQLSSWSLEDRVNHAKVLVRHMGWHHADFPWPKVSLIIGHGSHTSNNPHEAGLACGACGGQSGELSAKIAAFLLNQSDVRQALLNDSITIPESTTFVGGVHETVTDEVVFFTEDDSQAEAVKPYQEVFEAASLKANTERSLKLGEVASESNQRSFDPVEILPEAGLAGCAHFLAVRRKHLRGFDLEGRAFLNSYHAEWDDDLAGLELLLTAPMVVATWINLQYYASTVAPSLLGAGDKLTHSMVGQFGVFEGLGADLRGGLPLQSVYDGEKFFHQPIRLQAMVEAKPENIMSIIKKHPNVQELLDNEWLILRSLNPETGEIVKWTPHQGF